MNRLKKRSRRVARRLARKVLVATREDGQRGPNPRPRKKRPKTIARGWDTYARRRSGEARIGDVWNDPQVMGLEIDDDADVVAHLDRVVFEPFLGAPSVIVEIGPGGGRFTEVLLPKCDVLHAVDTSPRMVDALRARFGEDRGIVYHLADGKGLGMLADASVDAAFSYGVFVHLQHWDIFNYLRELERVLRPGGKAIIQHSNIFSELGWNRFLYETPRQLNRHKRHDTFVVNSPELMTEFISRAGLEPVEMVTNVAKRDCIALMRKPDSPRQD